MHRVLRSSNLAGCSTCSLCGQFSDRLRDLRKREWRGAHSFLVTITAASASAALSFLIVHGINAMQAALLSHHRSDLPGNLSARRIHTQVSLIRKIIITAIVIVAIGSVLILFDPVGQFGTSILASAGIAWIVIGFATQRTLGNVLAGIQIALTQPLLIDDIVVVEGEFGQIEEITFTYVTVRTWDLRRMMLPITYFVEKPFQNWSRVSTELLGTVVVYLDYQTPIGELRRELKRLVENNPNGTEGCAGYR
jgi:small-conductance mechanosensitive channel